MSYVCKLKNDKASYILDTGVSFGSGLEVAERLTLEHVSRHYDAQIIEDIKEFFTDVKDALSLGLQGTHRLTFDSNEIRVTAYLRDKIFQFEDRSNHYLKIKITNRYIDQLESEW